MPKLLRGARTFRWATSTPRPASTSASSASSARPAGPPAQFAILSRDGHGIMLRRVDEPGSHPADRVAGRHLGRLLLDRRRQGLHAELDRRPTSSTVPLMQDAYRMLEFAVRDRDGHVLGFGQSVETGKLFRTLQARLRRLRAPAELDKPLRDELSSIEQLEERARALGARLTIDPAPSRAANRSYPRLEENARLLDAAYRTLADDVRRGDFITPASEWILDTDLVATEIRGVRQNLPRDYYRELPKLAARARRHRPRLRHRGRADPPFRQPTRPARS